MCYYFSGNSFILIIGLFVTKIIFRQERLFRGERSVFMTATKKLLSYIDTLTPEQIEKLVNHLPKLTSLLEEQAQPYPREQIV